ncbi:MAG: hypothetical protein II441_03725, partial [Oscillospiraceae bacterium]|nr:hypothetical protein [Oscillospiraceae bacterium]
LIPLIMSSMERIDTVANAMELRGFGKNRKRTWYMSRPFRAGDIAAIALGILMAAVSLAYTAYNGSRYWNPFGKRSRTEHLETRKKEGLKAFLFIGIYYSFTL